MFTRKMPFSLVLSPKMLTPQAMLLTDRCVNRSYFYRPVVVQMPINSIYSQLLMIYMR